MRPNNVYGDSSYGDGPDNDYVRGSSQASPRMGGDEFRQSRSRSSFVGNQYEFDEYGQLSADDFGYRSGSRPSVSGSDTRGRGVIDEGRRNVLKNLSDQVPRYARSSSVGNQFDFRHKQPDRLSRNLGYNDYDEYDDYNRSSQGSYSGRPMVDYIERNPDQYSREIGSFNKQKYSPWGPVGESLIDYQYKNNVNRGSNYDFYNDSRGSRTSKPYGKPNNDLRGPPRSDYDSLNDRNYARGSRYNDNFDDREFAPRGRDNYDMYNDRDGPPGGRPGRSGYDSVGTRGRDDFDSGPRGFDDRGGPRRNNYDEYNNQGNYGYSPQNLSRSELQQRRTDLIDYVEDLEDREYQERPMGGNNRMASNRDVSRETDRVLREFEDMEGMYDDEFDPYY